MYRRRRRDDIPQDNTDRWLLTYADLITLLLAFFIVMYSMSQIDAKQFGRVSKALRGILKGGPSVLKHLDESQFTGHGLLKFGDLSMLQTKLHNEIKEIGRKGDIMTEVNERGLTIHIMESAMFDEGQADLKTRAQELLDIVAQDIIKMPNHVRVEGHTDDRPIQTTQFPSNWELSANRATTIVRYLIDQHNYPAEKISAAGYASFRPYVPNTTIENRSRNRRVDIVIQTMELSAAEPGSKLQNFAIDQVNQIVSDAEETNTEPAGNNFPN
ncbi:MAG: OmpA family protein [candidate division Zixibacteria bacterium]|nr:OmpA family protein [candidate division Zixibacteria bacterium]